MPETRRRYDPDFGESAVWVVRATHKPIAHVARDLGINPGTLGTWVAGDKVARGDNEKPTVADQVRVKQFEREVAELRMERDGRARIRPPG